MRGGFRREVRLREGGSYELRPLQPEDRERIRSLFTRCSPASIRFRFLHLIKSLPEEMLDHLFQVDGDRQVALVVVRETADEPQIIAVGRYHKLAERPDVAEVSFLVEDAWQRRGIGTQLLEALVEIALTHGIVRFSADVLSDNLLMLSVFRQAGYALSSATSYGVTHLEFPILPRAAVETDTS